MMDLPGAPQAFWLLARLRLVRLLNMGGALRWGKQRQGAGRQATRGKKNARWLVTAVLSAFMLFAFLNTASTSLTNPHLKIFHDDAADVYLNGEPIATLPGSTGGYTFVALTDAARKLLKAGANTLAIHVHQDRGGQYIDAGIVDVVER